MAKIPAPGTIVEINTRSEPNYLGSEFKNGSLVKLVKYAVSYFGRAQGFERVGAYCNEHWATVESQSGQRTVVSTSVLREIGGVTELMNSRDIDERRIGDLPETKFWEGDLVVSEAGVELQVETVMYGDIGRFMPDGSPLPVYMCSEVGDPAGLIPFREDQLTLIERGNVWKRAHGEELSFASDLDEFLFYIRVSEAKAQSKPQSEPYPFRWSAEEILDHIRNGNADFSHGASQIPYKFDDPEIGKKAREYWLEQHDPEFTRHMTPPTTGNM